MRDLRIPLPASLDLAGVAALAATLASAQADPEARVVVLTGAGGEVFCTGLDAESLLASEESSARRAAVENYQRALLSLREGRHPTIALVEGAARGGGVGLAAACDLVIASERASFALPESLFGLAPAMVFAVLRERMLPQRARLWALSPHPRSAAEALAAGLCDEVVGPEKLERTLRRWVRNLGRSQTRSSEAIKTLTSQTAGQSLRAALQAGGDLTLQAISDPLVRASLQAFREDGRVGEEEY